MGDAPISLEKSPLERPHLFRLRRGPPDRAPGRRLHALRTSPAGRLRPRVPAGRERSRGASGVALALRGGVADRSGGRRLAGRRLDAARRSGAASLRQGRGAQSDRFVQEPRHGARGLGGARVRRRRPAGALRRQRRRSARGLRRRGRPAGHGRDARGHAGGVRRRVPALRRRGDPRAGHDLRRREGAARARRQPARFDVSTLREPHRIEGKKTMGFELWEQFGGELPDVVVYPTGGGTGLIGMWKAWRELAELGWIARDARPPRMVSVQVEGCAPVVRAFDAGALRTEPFPNPATRAWGLRVPAPLGGFLCLRALRRDRRDRDRGERAGDGRGDARARATQRPRHLPRRRRGLGGARASCARAAGSRPANGSSSSTPAPASSTAELAACRLSVRV